VNTCAKCGACSVVCPVYRVTGQEAHTARGKIHLTQVSVLQGQGTVFEDIFSKCLLCGACSAVCPRGIDVCQEGVDARAAFPAIYGGHGYEKYLVRKALLHPEILSGMRVLGRAGVDFLSKHLPHESGLRLRLALFQHEVADGIATPVITPDTQNRQNGPLTFFPGCAARYLFPEIATSCGSLLESLGWTLQAPGELSCCGLAAFSAGDRQEARRCAENNIVILEQSRGPILISCASCYAHLCSYGKLFDDDASWRDRAEKVAIRLVEFSQFLDRYLPQRNLRQVERAATMRVYYHDPCHLRFGLKIVQEPRTVLGRHPGVELLELPDGPECCGQGGLFHVGAPKISAMIRDSLAARVLAMNPEMITSTCSGCLMQWRLAVAAAGSRVKVVHLAELLGVVRG
jgi:glycolate oxidase iron-sulfur subunit